MIPPRTFQVRNLHFSIGDSHAFLGFQGGSTNILQIIRCDSTKSCLATIASSACSRGTSDAHLNLRLVGAAVGAADELEVGFRAAV